MKLAGLGASLAINAHRSLKLLEFGIFTRGDDLLRGLSHELRFIAGNNILEELVLSRGVSRRRDIATVCWSAFDSLLTESGAFPILHRVSVKIWWYCRDLDPDRLVESMFPRLVESKAVEFNLCLEPAGPPT